MGDVDNASSPVSGELRCEICGQPVPDMEQDAAAFLRAGCRVFTFHGHTHYFCRHSELRWKLWFAETIACDERLVMKYRGQLLQELEAVQSRAAPLPEPSGGR